MTLPKIPDTLADNLRTASIETWLPLLRETVEREGVWKWRVAGTSMVPTLPPDSEIHIYPLSPSVSLGDIVVFVDANTNDLVVHRIVRRHKNGWITQGDNRLVPDRQVPSSHILGVVRYATYQGDAYYPPRYLKIIAISWLSRYHCLRFWRWIRRMAH